MDKPKQRSFQVARARWIADELVNALEPACHNKIQVAGSIRRGVALVHDIDLVAWPLRTGATSTDLFGNTTVTYGGPDGLAATIQSFTKEVVHSTPESKILRFAYNQVPVEVYLAEPDGKNFEALFQMRTGSAAHNAWLAQTARRLGLYYKAGYGIYKLAKDGLCYPENRVDDGTERGIYTALGMNYPEPSERI